MVIGEIIAGKVAKEGLDLLIDMAIDAFLSGVERGVIGKNVREMEAAGSTPTEITNMLENLRHASRKGAEDAVRGMPDD